MNQEDANKIILAMGRPLPVVPCTRCQGIGIHRSGRGTRTCFKCAGTGDISQGTGRSHPQFKPQRR